MAMTAKITSKGQTTLPAEARAILGVKPGDRVRYVRQDDGSLRIEKVDDSLESLRRIVRVGRRVSSQELETWIDEARAAIGGLGDRN